MFKVWGKHSPVTAASCLLSSNHNSNNNCNKKLKTKDEKYTHTQIHQFGWEVWNILRTNAFHVSISILVLQHFYGNDPNLSWRYYPLHLLLQCLLHWLTSGHKLLKYDHIIGPVDLHWDRWVLITKKGSWQSSESLFNKLPVTGKPIGFWSCNAFITWLSIPFEHNKSPVHNCMFWYLHIHTYETIKMSVRNTVYSYPYCSTVFETAPWKKWFCLPSCWRV